MSARFRTRYSQRHPVYVAPRVEGEGAVQEYKKDCDINQIIRKYKIQGIVPQNTRLDRGQFLDLTKIPDLQGIHERMEIARQKFMELPASVRSAFGNNPLTFLDAFKSREGLEMLEKLGVIRKAQPQSSNEATESITKPSAKKTSVKTSNPPKADGDSEG